MGKQRKKFALAGSFADYQQARSESQHPSQSKSEVMDAGQQQQQPSNEDMGQPSYGGN